MSPWEVLGRLLLAGSVLAVVAVVILDTARGMRRDVRRYRVIRDAAAEQAALDRELREARAARARWDATR